MSVWVTAGGVAAERSVPDAQRPAAWERPRTTRRYLHPPMAECMFTLWNDGKVMRGEHIHRHDWQVDYWKDLTADVIWVLHGTNDTPFDFRTAENHLPQDGTPFHGLFWRLAGMSVRMDAFCETGTRNPACFLRLTFEKDGDSAAKEPIAIHMRRMNESRVVKGSPDIYEPYETQAEPFLAASPSGYRALGPNEWRSDKVTIRAEGLPPDAHWDDRGAIRFTSAPESGRPIVVTFTIAASGNPARPQDWEGARSKASAYWRGELAKLNRLPKEVRANPGSLRLARNLTVQMLQCFCHPVGSNLTLPRQGGLQRYVWPWDCRFMLAALGRIGDFGEYIEGALDFYFSEYATDEGRIGPFRNNWICNTGECIHSLARYCLDTDSRAVWNRHRDAAMRGFDWIRRMRATPPVGSGVAGLFPAGHATDNPTPVQLWCFTDILTLDALGEFAEAARRFGDPRTAEVEAERDSLRDTLARIYRRFSADAKDIDELRLPLTPDGDDKELCEAGYFNLHQGDVMRVGLKFGFVPTNDVMKAYRWCLNHGKASTHGLCANHPPIIWRPKRHVHPYDRHVWYTTNAEMQWHNVFRRIGRRDLADLVWNATLRYAISPEYYVNERYRDDNPWYSPWSPNASGSGRILLMLLERSEPVHGSDGVLPRPNPSGTHAQGGGS